MTDLLDLASRRMNWLDDRQRILARNIANSDTPGYAPRDAAPFDQSLSAATVTPVQTNALHLGDSDEQAQTTMSRPTERSIDGNAVSLEQQMTAVADTDTQQRLASDLYGKYMTMFQTALGKS